MKYLIYSLLMALGILSFTSCLKEEIDIFGESSAERLIRISKEYEEILNSPANGWVMDYYAEFEESKKGGYQILCSFEKGKATLAGAFSMSNTYTMGEQHSSSYFIIDSEGPVLSFTTYNPVLHLFSDPSASNQDGYAGDYEFVIISASKEKIEMRGVKRNLKIVMYPLEVDKDWNTYCKEVTDLSKTLTSYSRFFIKKAGQVVGMATLVPEGNEFYNTEEIDLQSTKYAVTDAGINLYTAVSATQNTFERLVWDAENTKFIPLVASSDIEVLPTSLTYEEHFGTYKVFYDNMVDQVTITISEGVANKTLRVSKELLGYEFFITIKENKLEILGQTLDVLDSGNYLRLGVYYTTNMIIATGSDYSQTLPYKGYWFKGYADKPELRFFASESTSFLFPSYATGIRVIEYKGNSTAKAEIAGYKTLILSNLRFEKQ